MYDVSAIRNYILFLKKQHDLSISIHPIEYHSLIFSKELILFNIHDNSYCTKIKTFPFMWRKCADKQCKAFEKCSQGSYIGTCYAGVREFVYPIYDGEVNIGFISVSGYRAENSDSYIKTISKKHNLPIDMLKMSYNSLKEDIPDKKDIDTLIIPLCNMLELALMKTTDTPDAEVSFPQMIIRYIKQFHNQNITSKDICEHFSCSRSYMSTEFNQYTGKSIRDYINGLRIQDAKALLRHSKLSVTEIAFSVGFSDSNYFSSVFKKTVGMSPHNYRKTHIQK